MASQPSRANARAEDANYARGVRGRTGLTQSAFAARIGVPVETVRNWEQGKRSPRGPARALLKVIEEAPEAAFAVLAPARAALVVAWLPAARVPVDLAAAALLPDVLLGGCAMSSCPFLDR